MSLRVQAEVSVDGGQASVELKKLVGNVADTKTALAEVKAESARLNAELKQLNRTTAEGSARASELKQQLRANAAAEVEAAAAASRAARAYDDMNRSQGRVANSANQVRAATANLGQQIGDITQGLSAGISPATIFAQQAGQVGFALSGMKGAAKTVGDFLVGPWGIALTGAAVIMAPFVGRLIEAATASKDNSAALNAQKESAERLAVALRELDAITGKNTRSTRESAAAALEEAKANLARVSAARDEIAVELDRAILRQKSIDQNARLGGFAGAGAVQTARAATGFTIDELQKQRDEQEFLKAGATLEVQRIERQGRLATAIETVRLANDKAAAAETARRDAIKALNNEVLTTAQYTARVAVIDGQYRATIDSLSAAKKAAAAATREQNKELREAQREAERTAERIKKAAQAYDEYFRAIKAPQVGSLTGGEALDSLGRMVDGLDRAAAAAGAKTAQGFRDGALADAAAIGQAIGGSFGRVFASISALGFGTRSGGGRTFVNRDGKEQFVGGVRDFTGAGGRLEKLLSPLGEAFGNGGKRFAGLIGQAAGGAATGSVISGIGDALGIKNSKAGASIGGAIGSFIPIPGGEIIGSILGGLLPGLFGSRPKGSTTVSASGGKISQSSTGNSAIQKATGTIGNSITDAIQSIADQLGASIGDFSVSIGKEGKRFRVDTSGQGRTKKNKSTVLDFGEDEGAALAAAIADALKDGAIKSSPRVQAALTAYGDNVNKAVAEALKVKGLEDLLADRDNPFTSTFRQLEEQLKQRVDVAAKYGFDLVQIEKVNGEDRAKALKETLEASTSSVRQLLNDLKFGSRATGSPVERLAGLAAERDRLSGLVRGGDTSQLDAVAAIIQQIDELQKETFGSTGGFASGRADSVALLNDLVRQTEDRIKAAAEAARTAPNPQLTEANASLDDLVNGQALTNERLAQLIAGGFGFAGGSNLDLREFQR
jgi:hypothetical protein